MEILPVFKHALLISFIVFVMMLIVDFVDTASKRRISDLMRGGLWRQYFLSAFLGSTPGCLGAFMNVSLYVHGMISFGAIVDGHGMLPMLSYSLKDSLMIKAFNLVFGLGVGGTLLALGR